MKFITKMWTKLKTLLKQGLTPKQLALSIVVATLVSVFPIFGISTVILTALAIPMRLNLPIMIVISYIAEPLKLVLIIPFINIGATVFSTEHALLTYEAIKLGFEADVWITIKELSFELLCDAMGWTIMGIPSGILFYFILKAILTSVDKRRNKHLPIK